MFSKRETYFQILKKPKHIHYKNEKKNMEQMFESIEEKYSQFMNKQLNGKEQKI